MFPRSPSVASQYGFAILAVALAAILRLVLAPVLGQGVHFILLYPAVVLCAWFGGLWPGLLSSALGALIAWYIFIPPAYSFRFSDPTAPAQLIVFLLASALISMLAESLHRARRKTEKSEARERESHEKLRVTLASIGDAVIATDAQGRVNFMNQVAQSLTGWKYEEASGRPLEDVFNIVNERTRKPVDNPALRAMQEGVIVGLANHTVLIARDGTEIPIDDSGAPIRDAEGKTLGAVLIFRDITERKRAEEALKDADRRKDEFLAILAHELRNPLAPLRNGVELLKRVGLEPPQVREVRDMMERQVQQMARLVDDLLDISRVTRNKIRLEKEPTELATLVGLAVEISRPLIDRHRHELTISLPREPLRLNADPNRLAQAFANLLNNAAKFSGDGGRIALSAAREDDRVVVRVRDYGIGIPPAMLPRIFDMFAQADESLVYAEGGLGIGLTLVQALVEMHDGTVQALSEGLGKGSEFVVRLPLASAQPASEPARSGTVEKRVSGPPRRVLMVDDNKDAVMSLGMILEMQGHDVRVAHDAGSALAAAKAYMPEVVLLDIGLPGSDGYDVARQMRALPGLKNVVLAAVTGFGQEEDKRRAHDAGFNVHLTKPVDPGALAALLSRAELFQAPS